MGRDIMPVRFLTDGTLKLEGFKEGLIEEEKKRDHRGWYSTPG